jgi:hypothetical protein
MNLSERDARGPEEHECSQPGETLVAETLVTASSLRRNFRNFRKRYANQDGGRTLVTAGNLRGFPQFPQAICQLRRAGVPTQRQAAPVAAHVLARDLVGAADADPGQHTARRSAAVSSSSTQPSSLPRRSGGFCRQRVVRRTWQCSSICFHSPCKLYWAGSQVFFTMIGVPEFLRTMSRRNSTRRAGSACISRTTRPFTRCVARTRVCVLRKTC